MQKNILTLGQSNLGFFQSIHKGSQDLEMRAKDSFVDYSASSIRFMGTDGRFHTAHTRYEKNGSIPTTGINGYDSCVPFIGHYFVNYGGYNTVNFVDIAVGGSMIHHWTKNYNRTSSTANFGSNNWYKDRPLFDRVKWADYKMNKLGQRFDDILIHIGESDALKHTSKSDFKKYMKELIYDLRKLKSCRHAKIFVSLDSLIWGHKVNQNIISAQKEVINELSGVYFAVITDWIDAIHDDKLGVRSKAIYRHDGIHMNFRGMVYMAYYIYLNMKNPKEHSPI